MELNYQEELPVCAHRVEIIDAMRRSPVVVVCGDTGSGKTTQLPKMAMEAMPGARIACTQPRRLAAVAMAERVASETGTETGGGVGYRHRYARKTSRDTRIVFMTDGVLLAETRNDPLLRAYGVIIVDEAHERSLNVDFLLGILKRILARRRDLRVVVSSATLDTGRFSRFFDDAPVVSVPGRLHPVEIRWCPPPEDEDRDLPRDVSAALAGLPPSDDTLVFLPGERDIREVAERLSRDFPGDDVIPLLASLPASEQRRAFLPSSRRRTILATNVAETSVTIPGIRCVIDSGLARLPRYLHRTQVQRLQIEPVSQASALQRAGRCGRTGPGVCVRLYSREDFATRDEYTPPEILRTSLAGVILTMLDLGMGDIEDFPFIDPPKPATIRAGLRELLELGAICRGGDGGLALTPVGRRLARLPVEPRLARMLLAASDNAVLPHVLPVVAAMACDDPRRRPIEEREKADMRHAAFRVAGSDFLGILKLYRWWEESSPALSQSKARKLCKDNYLSFPRMREWRELARQLESLARRIGLSSVSPKTDEETFYAAFHRSILSGLLSRIGRYDEEEHEWRGAHGLRFSIHPGSVLCRREARKAPPQWIVAGELVDTARLLARDAAAVDPLWIESAAGPLCRHHVHSPEYDPRSGFVRATEQVTLYGLVLVPARRCDFSSREPALAREIFIRRALVDGDFPSPPPPLKENKALLDALRRRAETLRRPDMFDSDRLAAHFSGILPPDIASASALRKALRSGVLSADALRLRKKDWWPEDGDTDGFPSFIRIGGVKAALSYRHVPDDPDADGITCTVRRSNAEFLRLWRTDWLVPGMLPEKISYMLSVLPSSLRRLLFPIEDAVSCILSDVAPGSAPLTESLRGAISRQWGFDVPASAWKDLRLPPHLRVRFRIVDDNTGRVLALSRDLEEALAAAGVAGDGSCRSAASTSPSVSWTFGTIPETSSDESGGVRVIHHPALHDEGEGGVTLRLYADPEDAAAAHAAGTTRLYLLALDRSLRVPFRRKTLPLAAQLRLKGLGWDDASMTEDIFAGAVRETFVRNRPPVRGPDEFKRRMEEGRNALVEIQCEMARIVGGAMAAAAGVEKLLEDTNLPTETVASVRTQLDWLLYKGFPRRVPLARLKHYARYLKGATIRLERAGFNPSGDLAKEALLSPWWERYVRAAAGRGRYKTTALAEFRWAVEEYRVSLFAQELHTPEPVSPQRLAEKWVRAEGGGQCP